MLDAAKILSATPEAMQLRYLATLNDIGAQNSSTIVFPFPMDMLHLLREKKSQD